MLSEWNCTGLESWQKLQRAQGRMKGQYDRRVEPRQFLPR